MFRCLVFFFGHLRFKRTTTSDWEGLNKAALQLGHMSCQGPQRIRGQQRSLPALEGACSFDPFQKLFLVVGPRLEASNWSRLGSLMLRLIRA